MCLSSGCMTMYDKLIQHVYRRVAKSFAFNTEIKCPTKFAQIVEHERNSGRLSVSVRRQKGCCEYCKNRGTRPILWAPEPVEFLNLDYAFAVLSLQLCVGPPSSTRIIEMAPGEGQTSAQRLQPTHSSSITRGKRWPLDSTNSKL